MKNEIEEIRKDIIKYFDVNNRIGKEDYKLSETGNFYFTVEKFRQNDAKRNWIVSKIEIWKTGSPTFDFDYIANSEDVFDDYCWIIKDEIEYLFLPEAIGGQSVYDSQNKRLHSFYSNQEPFIWMGLYPSPDMNKLAVDGCYWACPNELRIYDISEITKLPYKLIYQESNFGDGCVVEQWKDNTHLTICRNDRNILTIALDINESD